MWVQGARFDPKQFQGEKDKKEERKVKKCVYSGI